MDDSTLRIEIALRAGMIAKAALEMVNLDPRLVILQIHQVESQIYDLDAVIRKSREARDHGGSVHL